jgi:methylenetetrahydrofolate reductase (NADPH)
MSERSSTAPSSDDPVHERLVELHETFSIEVTPHEIDRVSPLDAALAPGTSVFITYLPNAGFDGTLATARRVAAAGMRPVPHIAARAVRSASELDDLLNRLAGDAGVSAVLVIAGSIASPAGPFTSSAEVLRTGLLERHGIRTAGVAGHPEGSPDIDPAALAQAIADKNELAADTDLELQLVTQFAFAADPIVHWERAVREAGNRLPVRVGLPGAASAATLVRFGLRCGVGPSLTVMRKHAGSLRKLASARPQYPDTTAVGVARASVDDPASLFSAFHFFPFGSFATTATWAGHLREGRFTIASGDRVVIT